MKPVPIPVPESRLGARLRAFHPHRVPDGAKVSALAASIDAEVASLRSQIGRTDALVCKLQDERSALAQALSATQAALRDLDNDLAAVLTDTNERELRPLIGRYAPVLSIVPDPAKYGPWAPFRSAGKAG